MPRIGTHSQCSLLVVLPLAARNTWPSLSGPGSPVPCACDELTPPIHRAPPGPHTGSSPTEDPPQASLCPGITHSPVSSHRCFVSMRQVVHTCSSSSPARRPRRTYLHHWHSTDRADDLLHHHWTHVGAQNRVVAGQAAFRYSLMSPPQRAVFTIWIFWTADTVQATFRAPETTGGLQPAIRCLRPTRTNTGTNTPFGTVDILSRTKARPSVAVAPCNQHRCGCTTASAPGRYTVPARQGQRRRVAGGVPLRLPKGSAAVSGAGAGGRSERLARDAAGVVVEGGDQRGERHRMRGGGRETLSAPVVVSRVAIAGGQPAGRQGSWWRDPRPLWRRPPAAR